MPTPRSARRVLVAKGHRLTASNRRTRCRSSDSRTKGDTSISPEVLDHHQIASILNQLLERDGVSEDIHLFNEKLREWEDYYNYHRPHGALAGQTPYERLLAKTRAEPLPNA